MSTEGHKLAVAHFMEIIEPTAMVADATDESYSITGGLSNNKGKYTTIRKNVAYLNVHINYANHVLEQGWISPQNWTMLNTWQKFMLDRYYYLYVLSIPFRENTHDSEALSQNEKLTTFSLYLDICANNVPYYPVTDIKNIRIAQQAMLKQPGDSPAAKRTYSQTIWDYFNRAILKIILDDNMRRLSEALAIDKTEYDQHIRKPIGDAVRTVRNSDDKKIKDWQTDALYKRIQTLAETATDDRYTQAFTQILRNRCLLMGITRKFFSVSRAKAAPRPPALIDSLFFDSDDAAAGSAAPRSSLAEDASSDEDNDGDGDGGGDGGGVGYSGGDGVGDGVGVGYSGGGGDGDGGGYGGISANDLGYDYLSSVTENESNNLDLGGGASQSDPEDFDDGISQRESDAAWTSNFN